MKFLFTLAAVLTGLSPWTLVSSSSLAENVVICNDCHGKNGVSDHSDVPTIAGFSAITIQDMMFAYKDDIRPAKSSRFRRGDTNRQETDMKAITQLLSDADIVQLSEHYANQNFIAAKQPFDNAKVETGAEVHQYQCSKCHEEGGSSMEDDAGILAGQWTEYLEQAFSDFRAGERESERKMIKAVNKLTTEEVDALLHYYASQQ